MVGLYSRLLPVLGLFSALFLWGRGGLEGIKVSHASAGSLTVGPATLPEAQIGVEFASEVTATGGKAPYTWSVSGGMLPSGLSVDSTNGVIAGTPRQAGTFFFTLHVADSAAVTASQSWTFQVADVRLDQYGGLTALPSPTGATGFFHIQQLGKCWMLISPEGNGFFLNSVYSINPTLVGGSEYTNAVNAKYPPGQWRIQAVRRLRSWGFNTIGEYADPHVYPIGVSQSTGNPQQLPFIHMIRPSWYSLASGAVKDIVYGTDPKIYTGWRGDTFPDVYDGNFALWASKLVSDYVKVFNQPLDSSPWLIGTTTDDGDNLWGFRRSADAHDGWLVAVTAPTQSGNTQLNVTYVDTTVYSKLAWSNFLRGKYGTIDRLNAAWGSNYTTFGSNGGWGRGSGVLDENGSHAWIGKDYTNLTDTNPSTAADMNAFLGMLADAYFSTVSRALRTALPHHLVFGPAALNGSARPQVLQAAGKYLDALQVGAKPTDILDIANNGKNSILNAYTISGKPIFMYLTIQSQLDSPFSAYQGWPGYDMPTQAARGAQYTATVQQLANLRGADGLAPALGTDWWEWVDQIVGGEHTNFGLVTDLDNAYDGQEDVIPLGKDPWGYTTGGQSADYGDFLSSVQRANLHIASALSLGQNP